MSEVDVIVPCYKYAHFLRGCVESALTQAGVDVRVLVIDDCSPDNTPQVARELTEKDSRVEYRRHERNVGHIATYNEGLLGWAAREYSILLSADDMLTPGALYRATRLMDAHPEVGLTYGRAIETDQPGLVGGAFGLDCDGKVVGGAEFFDRGCLGGCNMISTPTATVRTKLQQKIGGYRKELPHSGDMEMWLRFALHTSLGILDADQAYYRVHAENMHWQFRGMRDLEQAKEAFDILFSEYRSLIPNYKALKRQTYFNLAREAFWSASRFFERDDREQCEASLQTALHIFPRLCWWPAWWRLRCKRALGPRRWLALRPLLYRLLGRTLPGAAPGQGSAS